MGMCQNPETGKPEQMRPKRKWFADLARMVADGLIEWIGPHCEPGYVVAAGSLRRGKLTVGDVEILYASAVGPVKRPGEMFASEGSLADMMIDVLVHEKKLAHRLNVNGQTTWGPLNKLAVHTATGMPVDLFATTPQNWFVSLVIRTGPADLNVRLATAAQKRGLHLNVCGMLTHLGSGEQIFPQSEREVFELCGLRYLEPEERS